MRKALVQPRTREKAATVSSRATAQVKTQAIEAPEADKALERLAASRIVIEGVSPEIDGGRFPAKAAEGDLFTIEADIFADGHDKIDAALLIRRAGSEAWTEAPMAYFDNDRWRGVATVSEIGRYDYTITAWRDLFASWRDEVSKKHAAGLPLGLEMQEGRNLIEAATGKDGRATADDKQVLKALLERVDAAAADGDRLAALMAQDTAAVMKRAPPRTNLTRYDRVLTLLVERKRAALSAWYELMPRSTSNDPTRHGYFRRRDRAPALCAGSGVRRPLFPADPPDWAGASQGQEQQPDRRC